MPANPKYLTASPWQRFAKISAAIIGGYALAMSLHLAIALWLPGHKITITTLSYSLYILWVALMFIPFLFTNGWKCWLLYLGLIVLCCVAIFFGKIYQPVY